MTERSLTDRLLAQLPDIALPKLGREVSIPGWLSWELAFLVPNLMGGLLAHIVLLVATSTGKALLGGFSLPPWLKGKSTAAKLEDEIEKTKGQVEEALSRIDVSLHRELYDHAFRDGPRGPVGRVEREAWPLPGYVRMHLDDGESGSWW